MSDAVYSVTEIVGSSNKSIEEAIKTGIATASKSLRNLSWFEVKEIRGDISGADIRHYQVVMKVGFRYEK
ncbi:MAG: dodecin domain-containing protein [Candidatus Lambdaproteobacteria bacterium]|nr:dodecin domain-containing protein [Candidatus Lambdaproteobacteria bacterium]